MPFARLGFPVPPSPEFRTGRTQPGKGLRGSVSDRVSLSQSRSTTLKTLSTTIGDPGIRA